MNIVGTWQTFATTGAPIEMEVEGTEGSVSPEYGQREANYSLLIFICGNTLTDLKFHHFPILTS